MIQISSESKGEQYSETDNREKSKNTPESALGIPRGVFGLATLSSNLSHRSAIGINPNPLCELVNPICVQKTNSQLLTLLRLGLMNVHLSDPLLSMFCWQK